MNVSISKLVNGLVEKNNLYYFYRCVYKGVACGPTIGFRLNGKWKYNSELPCKVSKKTKVDAVSVSSIVEGSDAEVEAIVLTGRFSKKRFWEVVEEVNDKASMLWDEANEEWF